jgi:hypothetical protein
LTRIPRWQTLFTVQADTPRATRESDRGFGIEASSQSLRDGGADAFEVTNSGIDLEQFFRGEVGDGVVTELLGIG